MTPDQLAKSGTEHGHQSALFAYVAVARMHGFAAADAWAVGASLPDYLKPGLSQPVPALEWFHAIHNQGHGDKVRGANAKAEGVRAGVADTFLPWPVFETLKFQADGHFEDNHFVESEVFSADRIKWAGLYIEMKKPSEKPKKEGKGGVSEAQRKFGDYAKAVGYGWIVCYSWREAADALRSYIEWKG